MTVRGVILVLMVPAVVAGVVGCRDESDPSTTPAQSRSTDHQAADKPVESSDSPAQSSSADDVRRGESQERPVPEDTGTLADERPPSVSQIAGVIDLRDIALPRAVTLPRRLAGFYSCVAGISVEDARSFLREQLTAMGCEEVSSEYDEEYEYYTDIYSKDGYLIRANASKQQATLGGSQQSSLVILNRGRLDARELPRIGDATVKESTPASISFETAASVTEAVAQLGPVLDEAGWVQYGEKNPTASDNLQIVGFFHHGHKLQVIVYGPGSNAGNEKTVVTYQMGVRNFELPVPPRAVDIVLDDIQGTLTCKSTVRLNDVVSFYRGHFPELGWERNDKLGHVDDDSATLVYKRGVDSTWVELQQEDDTVDVKLKRLAN